MESVSEGYLLHDHQIVMLSLRHFWTNQSKQKCTSGDAPIGKNQTGLIHTQSFIQNLSTPTISAGHTGYKVLLRKTFQAGSEFKF